VDFAERLQRDWYRERLTPLTAALSPAAPLFRAASALRRTLYKRGLLSVQRLPVPVVIVGNIAVGGSGKTPLTIALARSLAARGWHPGLVSRGYGGSGAVRVVAADASADEVGDEPLLLAAAGFPVAVGADRPAAARALLAAHPACDVLLCDDGLQHYALARDVEIVAIDGERGFGNGRTLPAGPLRELPARLAAADAVVVLDGPAPPAPVPVFAMRYVSGSFQRVDDARIEADATRFQGAGVHAIAGIAHPQRFFADLAALGIRATLHAFPDHHRFTAAELALPGATAILMTQKDAVKCAAFADHRCWMLPVRADVDAGLCKLVEEKIVGRQAARDPGVSRHQGTAHP
jgi:tetraacyldisaccharide 4'-kinase